MAITGQCRKCGGELRIRPVDGLCPACREALAEAPTIKEAASSETAPPEAAAEARPSFGDYQILCEIAEGGMGVVYKARQLSLNRIVALKMVRSDRLSRENDVKRFRTEAQAAGQLQHPNIVAIHEVGEVAGQHFYSMDYIEGRSLSTLAREKTLAPRDAASCVKVIAEAIHYAHQQGVLHRDLKPSNVLIDRNNQPRVADFGLAKLLAVDSELTLSGVVMGTPSYMPPEQATGRNNEIDARSDIYSLGAILYDLLCGRPPFRADTAVETLKQVVELEPVSPRLLNPRVPRDLETICLKCLEKDPASRYASAGAVADELDRFLRDVPIAARPISRPERVWRWSKRKPASAAALALLMFVAVGSPLAAFFINQARRAAEHSRAVAEANLYVAEMNLALEDIEADHRARAITLLNKHIPQPGAEDRRSFEWRYIWRQARGDYAFKLGFHNDAVRQVLFSPDGRLLASRSMDGTLKIWRLRARPSSSSSISAGVTSRHERLTLTNVVSMGGFSGDGESLAISTEHGEIQKVDTATGGITPVLANAGFLIKWLPLDDTFVATSTNFLLKRWRPRARPSSSSSSSISLGVMPGVGGGDPGRGARWALSVVASSNATIAASIDKTDPAHGKRLVRVWDVTTGRELARTKPAPNAIVALQISPDGMHVAYAVEEMLHVWNWRERSEPSVIQAHNTAVRMIAFSPDGRLVATGASDQFIRIWETRTGQLLQVRKGHENSVRALAFSDGGRWLASGGLNEDVRLWDLDRPAEADSLEAGDAPELTKDKARQLRFTPDSKAIAFVTATNSAVMLDALSLQTIAVRTNVLAVPGFAPDGELLILSVDGEGIQLWNPRRNSVADWLAEVKGRIAISSDLQMAAVAPKRAPLRLLHTSAKTEAAFPTPTNRQLEHLTFSPDGKMIAASDDKHEVHLWSIRFRARPSSSISSASAGTLATTFRDHADDVNHLAFSNDSRLLASASSDKYVILWNVATGQRHAVLKGHRHAVYAVAFSPDGKLLATGSLDNTVTLWNLGLLQEVGRFSTSTDDILSEKGVFMVAFSPDGNTLAARLRDGSVRLWRAASWEQIRREGLAEAKQ